jgi:hypothetical protein
MTQQTNTSSSYWANAHKKITSIIDDSRFRMFTIAQKVKPMVEDEAGMAGHNTAGQQQPEKHSALRFTMWQKGNDSIYMQILRILGRAPAFKLALQYFINSMKQNAEHKEELKLFYAMVSDYLKQTPSMSNYTLAMNLLEQIKAAFELVFINQAYQSPMLETTPEARAVNTPRLSSP